MDIFECFFERNIIVWTRGTQRKTQLLIKELIRSARELDAFLSTQKKLSDDNKLIHTLELTKEANGAWSIVHAEENLSKNKVCIYNHQLDDVDIGSLIMEALVQKQLNQKKRVESAGVLAESAGASVESAGVSAESTGASAESAGASAESAGASAESAGASVDTEVNVVTASEFVYAKKSMVSFYDKKNEEERKKQNENQGIKGDPRKSRKLSENDEREKTAKQRGEIEKGMKVGVKEDTRGEKEKGEKEKGEKTAKIIEEGEYEEAEEEEEEEEEEQEEALKEGEESDEEEDENEEEGKKDAVKYTEDEPQKAKQAEENSKEFRDQKELEERKQRLKKELTKLWQVHLDTQYQWQDINQQLYESEHQQQKIQQQQQQQQMPLEKQQKENEQHEQQQQELKQQKQKKLQYEQQQQQQQHEQLEKQQEEPMDLSVSLKDTPRPNRCRQRHPAEPLGSSKQEEQQKIGFDPTAVSATPVRVSKQVTTKNL